ncbi:MAG: hypothetical protein Tsb009_19970 [Planctomycetaceae bacterium]
MKRLIVKLLVLSTIFLVSNSVAAKRAEAGLIPDIWNALFGPPGTPYVAGYPYSPGYSYYAGYAPSSPFGGTCSPCVTRRVYYVPSCNPCVPSCNPCAVSTCNPCAIGGPCQISSAAKTTGKLKPEKEPNGLPKTFKNGTGAGEGSNDGTKPPTPGKDSKFNSRDETKKFGPTRKKESGEGDAPKFPSPNGNGTGGGTPPDFGTGTQKSFKVPEKEVPETLIKKRKPAEKKPANGNQQKTPKAKTNLNNGPNLKPLNLDEKITWRAVPRRTRLIIHTRPLSSKVARTKWDANKNWTPVSRGSKLAGK